MSIEQNLTIKKGKSDKGEEKFLLTENTVPSNSRNSRIIKDRLKLDLSTLDKLHSNENSYIKK